METKYFNRISFAERLYFLSFHNVALYLQTMRGIRGRINLQKISCVERSCEFYCSIARSDFNKKVCQHLQTKGDAFAKTAPPPPSYVPDNASLCVPQKSGHISCVILRDVYKRHSTIFVWQHEPVSWKRIEIV